MIKHFRTDIENILGIYNLDEYVSDSFFNIFSTSIAFVSYYFLFTYLHIYLVLYLHIYEFNTLK